MKKGMTLIEMILAVALLAILGMIVLQMFLSAQTMNQKAKELDLAVAQCVTAVETIKSFEGMVPDETIQETAFLFAAERVWTETSFKFVWFYDAQMQPQETINQSEAYYRMQMIWEKDPESNGKTGLVKVTYERLRKSLGFSEEMELLYTLTAGVAALPGGEQP